MTANAPRYPLPGWFRTGATAEATERMLLLGFLAVRTGALCAALVGAVSRSLAGGSNGWGWAGWCVASLESVVVGVWLLRRRGPLARSRATPWALALDVVVSVGTMFLTWTSAGGGDRIAAWDMGLHAVNVSTVMFLGFAVHSFRRAVLGASVLGLVFAVVALPSEGDLLHVVVLRGGDAVAYVGLVLPTWAFARMCRDLARAADRARDLLAELERERSRNRVQHLLPFLRPELLEGADENTRALVARQARASYRAMRAFVDGCTDPRTGHPSPVAPHQPGPHQPGPSQVAPARWLNGVFTRTDVERVIVLGFLGVRTVYLVVAFVGVGLRSVAEGDPRAAALGGLGAMAAMSVVTGRRLRRDASLLVSRWPVVTDLVTTVLALGAVVLATAPQDRTGAWSTGVFTVSLTTAMLVGARVRRPGRVLAGAGALAAYWVAVNVAPSWDDTTTVAMYATEASVYLGFAAATWVLFRVARGLSEIADSARRRVRVLELERSRAQIHDLLPFLRPEHFTTRDEEIRRHLDRQARAKYRQMRAFVEGQEQSQGLETHLLSIVDLHPRLCVRTVTDLDREPLVAEETRQALARAVDTALANVEQNAPEARVVLSAACDGETVTVTVHDDGPGFDPSQVRPGFGISHILGRHLEEVGGRGTVVSAPGRGTEVCVVVPRVGGRRT